MEREPNGVQSIRDTDVVIHERLLVAKSPGRTLGATNLWHVVKGRQREVVASFQDALDVAFAWLIGTDGKLFRQDLNGRQELVDPLT